jgi:hypothetical protein
VSRRARVVPRSAVAHRSSAPGDRSSGPAWRARTRCGGMTA